MEATLLPVRHHLEILPREYYTCFYRSVRLLTSPDCALSMCHLYWYNIMLVYCRICSLGHS